LATLIQTGRREIYALSFRVSAIAMVAVTVAFGVVFEQVNDLHKMEGMVVVGGNPNSDIAKSGHVLTFDWYQFIISFSG
jgi:hypothetical protein